MSTKSSDSDNGSEIKMLKDALKCVTGQLDFAKYAEKQGVANAEAMCVSLGHHFFESNQARRKRFKRVFEKDEEGLMIKGNAIGAGDGTQATPKTPSAKTPRTPKAKPAPLSDGGSPSKAPASRKRKTTTATDGADEVEVVEDGEKSTKKSKTARTKTPKKVTNGESEESEEVTRIGSPAVQAKVGTAVKDAEMDGIEVDSPAKQAIHDGIEKTMN